MKTIITYFRDNKELEYEEWNKKLEEDLIKENKNSIWQSSIYSIRTELDKGRIVELDGHYYYIKTDSEYSSLRELFDEVMFQVPNEIIFKAFEKLTDDEIFNILSKMECVSLENNKFILKDENFWE